MNKSESEDKSNLKEEYSYTVELYKHYATIQFAQLTVFLLLMSNIGTFFFRFRTEQELSEPWNCVVPFGFSILSFLFLVMHLSHSYMGEHFLKRLTYIEEILEYQLYSKLQFGESEPKALDKHSFRPTRLILPSLYAIGTIVWLIICFIN